MPILPGMRFDLVDELVQTWARERPDLDVSKLAVVSRISLLAKHFDRQDREALNRIGLQPWAYEVIVALRRHGPPYQLSPTELRRMAVLSSGAMTTRLDRLEERGLITRSLSSLDRRSFVVTLTPAGQELADRAIATRLEEVERWLAPLSDEDREVLSALLRQLLLGVATEVTP